MDAGNLNLDPYAYSKYFIDVISPAKFLKDQHGMAHLAVLGQPSFTKVLRWPVYYSVVMAKLLLWCVP